MKIPKFRNRKIGIQDRMYHLFQIRQASSLKVSEILRALDILPTEIYPELESAEKRKLVEWDTTHGLVTITQLGKEHLELFK